MIRALTSEEITRERIEAFSRTPSPRHYCKKQGIWVLREYEAQTPKPENAEQIVLQLQELLAGDGTVLSAWDEEQCVGLCGIGSKRFGPQKEYVELQELLVSEQLRSHDTVRELIDMVKQTGRQLGAEYLYMEAPAGEREQRGLQMLGFREAAWYKGTANSEARLIAMECPLNGDWRVQDVYTHCPTLNSSRMSIGLVQMSDAEELLRCYSDVEAQLIFNSDNCRDAFRYETMAEMEEAILFWMDAYEAKEFVRFSVRDDWTNEAVGTVELYHYMGEDAWKHRGIMRLDLRSDYETAERLDEILYMLNRYAYDLFHVTTLATKAVPRATKRIQALKQAGYQLTEEKLLEQYGDYYVRECLHS